MTRNEAIEKLRNNKDTVRMDSKMMVAALELFGLIKLEEEMKEIIADARHSCIDTDAFIEYLAEHGYKIVKK